MSYIWRERLWHFQDSQNMSALIAKGGVWVWKGGGVWSAVVLPCIAHIPLINDSRVPHAALLSADFCGGGCGSDDPRFSTDKPRLPSSAKNPRYEPKETSCRSATIGNSDRHQQYAKLPIRWVIFIWFCVYRYVFIRYSRVKKRVIGWIFR